MQPISSADIWRPIPWIALLTALILAVPLVAMQFTAEVNWTAGDFIVAGGLLFVTGLAYALTVHNRRDRIYRLGVGLALFAALLLTWVNLAVGVIGDAGNPANRMYVAVLAVGIGGAIFARLRAAGMSRVLWAMAIVQASIAVIALVDPLGEASGRPLEILLTNGFFVVLFVASGWLFHRAARNGAGSA